MRWTAALVLAGFVCFGRAQDRPPGQQPPVFRAGVDVVQVEASILDADRRPVHGLTRENFQVFENRQQQEIVDVQEILLGTEPTPPVWADAVKADVATNDLVDRRLLAIVMDDLNCCVLEATPTAPDLFASDRWAIENAIATAHRLIDGLGPRDLATVALTHDLVPILRFTSDREALRDVVGRFAPVTESRYCMPEPPYPRPETDLTRLLALSPQPIKAVVVLKSLVPIDRRKLPNLPCPPRSYQMPDTGRRVLSGQPDPGRQPDPLSLPRVPVYYLNISGLLVERSLFRQNGPNLSGGRNFYLTNDLQPAVDELLHENNSYYLIGFRTSRPTVDGKYRLLDIKVTRPGDYTVRTRAGYFRPTPPPKPGSRADRNVELARPPASVAGLLPSSDITMTAAVAAFASPGADGAMLVTAVDVTHPVTDSPWSASEELTLRTVAYSAGDAKYDAREKASVAVPAGVSGVSTSVASTLKVVPDQYELWLTVQEPRTNRIGGLFYTIDVPDFLAQTVTVSGIVLGREPAEGSSLPRVLKGLVPIVPTTARTFGKSDEITAFFRVYQGRNVTPAPVTLSVRVLDDQGATSLDVNELLDPDRFTPTGAAEYRLRLPFERLATGRHLLTIEARVAGRTSPKRDVPFSVR
jgi:hypothetical protein